MIRMEPIGTVVNDYRTPEDLHVACREGRDFQGVSRIFLKEHLASGLEGLSGFSHLWVLYYLDKAEGRTEMKARGPPFVEGLPEVGVFASRSQYRPNHIALRLVRLLDIRDNILEVQGLDAINETPILDIKPFVKGFDYPDNPVTSDWFRWLEDGR
jgi:tRNA-Thr(GGU) m(6)t(6)A37 methyltransferase TsaA